jgi:hypothetical protein
MQPKKLFVPGKMAFPATHGLRKDSLPTVKPLKKAVSGEFFAAVLG